MEPGKGKDIGKMSGRKTEKSDDDSEIYEYSSSSEDGISNHAGVEYLNNSEESNGDTGESSHSFTIVDSDESNNYSSSSDDDCSDSGEYSHDNIDEQEANATSNIDEQEANATSYVKVHKYAVGNSSNEGPGEGVCDGTLFRHGNRLLHWGGVASPEQANTVSNQRSLFCIYPEDHGAERKWALKRFPYVTGPFGTMCRSLVATFTHLPKEEGYTSGVSLFGGLSVTETAVGEACATELTVQGAEYICSQSHKKVNILFKEAVLGAATISDHPGPRFGAAHTTTRWSHLLWGGMYTIVSERGIHRINWNVDSIYRRLIASYPGAHVAQPWKKELLCPPPRQLYGAEMQNISVDEERVLIYGGHIEAIFNVIKSGSTEIPTNKHIFVLTRIHPFQSSACPWTTDCVKVDGFCNFLEQPKGLIYDDRLFVYGGVEQAIYSIHVKEITQSLGSAASQEMGVISAKVKFKKVASRIGGWTLRGTVALYECEMILFGGIGVDYKPFCKIVSVALDKINNSEGHVGKQDEYSLQNEDLDAYAEPYREPRQLRQQSSLGQQQEGLHAQQQLQQQEQQQEKQQQQQEQEPQESQEPKIGLTWDEIKRLGSLASWKKFIKHPDSRCKSGQAVVDRWANMQLKNIKDVVFLKWGGETNNDNRNRSSNSRCDLTHEKFIQLVNESDEACARLQEQAAKKEEDERLAKLAEERRKAEELEMLRKRAMEEKEEKERQIVIKEVLSDILEELEQRLSNPCAKWKSTF